MLGELMVGQVAMLAGSPCFGCHETRPMFAGFGAEFIGPMPDGSNQGTKDSTKILLTVGVLAAVFFALKR